MVAQETVTLSQSKLASFLNCQRQYQLRYATRITWPESPLPEPVATAVSQGHQFHQLIERHFLKLPVQPNSDKLRVWWQRFQHSGLTFPPGQLLIESSLTIPLALPEPTRNAYLLNGRFDLLIINNQEPSPSAHIYDWKTGRPQAIATLRQQWQTRLYLAMLAEGGGALFGNTTVVIPPENIQITYWYVEEPDAPRTIPYSTQAHQQNWRELQAIVQQIDQLNDETIWPLTDEWEHCRSCLYQIICGRQTAGTASAIVDEDEIPPMLDTLTPERP